VLPTLRKVREGWASPPPAGTHAIGTIVPALAKNARTGHPQFQNRKKKRMLEGRATRAGTMLGGWPMLLTSLESLPRRVPRPLRTLQRAGTMNTCAAGFRQTRSAVSAASYPPLQKTQGRGTHVSEAVRKLMLKGRATRPGTMLPTAGDFDLTPPRPETKSLPNLRLPALARLRPEDSVDNYSTPITPATPPIPVSPDCDACTVASPPVSWCSRH
jgi:hypothetical protein